MENKDLLKVLDEKYKEARAELGFKSSFQELNEIFYIQDSVLKDRYVSPRFSRQLCRRIAETYTSWINYFQGLLMPNPANLTLIAESKNLNEQDREELSLLISKTVALLVRNSIAGLNKDKEEEAKFIDDAVAFWNTTFKPGLIKILQKSKSEWDLKAQGIKQKKEDISYV